MGKEVTVIKKWDNGAKLLSDGTVTTPIARAAFVNLVTPRAQEGDNGTKGEPKYGLALLFPKGTNIDAILLAAQRKRKEKWGDKKPEEIPRFTNGVRDQGEKAEQYDGYVAGARYMNVSSKFKPEIVGRSPSEPKDASEIYSGCYVRCNLNPYAYGGEKKHKGNNGISFGLLKVQFIRDGEPLRGGSAADEVFDDEEGDDLDNDGGDLEDDDLIG